MKKVLAIASTGGHYVQLTRLMRPLRSDELDVVMVRTRMSKEDKPESQDHYLISDFSRSNWWLAPVVMTQVLRLILRERPDSIVSTGALPGFIAVFIGRCMGRKAIWIDSIANTQQLSASGKMAKFCCHQTLTQWKNVVQPGVEFQGRVI